MSDESNTCASPTPNAEPSVVRSAMPIWIMMVTSLLMFLGAIYFDRHSGWFDKQVYSPYVSAAELQAYQPKSGDAAALARGKRSYEMVCGACHANDGLGKPGQAPPLAGSEWVNTKSSSRLTHIALAGLNGPLQVGGKDWSLAMAPMGAALPDADLAAVLSYVRNSWGNKGGPVTADDVKAVRASLGGRPQPVTGEQLKSLPE